MFAVWSSTPTRVTTSPSAQRITVFTIMTSGEKEKLGGDCYHPLSRSTKQPLNVFKGHRKAVSYVKFLSSEDIVSASTDSQLKLWNVNQSHCARSFTGDTTIMFSVSSRQVCIFLLLAGHVNEKNFVGLATDGDYITCGSENNGLYVYYKGK